MRIIVFAPHNDDEVLGVGGTIAKYSASGNEVFICEATKGKSEEIVKMIRSEALEAHKILGVKETIFLDLPVYALGNTFNRYKRGVFKIIDDVRLYSLYSS